MPYALEIVPLAEHSYEVGPLGGHGFQPETWTEHETGPLTECGFEPGSWTHVWFGTGPLTEHGFEVENNSEAEPFESGPWTEHECVPVPVQVASGRGA